MYLYCFLLKIKLEKIRKLKTSIVSLHLLINTVCNFYAFLIKKMTRENCQENQLLEMARELLFEIYEPLKEKSCELIFIMLMNVFGSLKKLSILKPLQDWIILVKDNEQIIEIGNKKIAHIYYTKIF